MVGKSKETHHLVLTAWRGGFELSCGPCLGRFGTLRVDPVAGRSTITSSNCKELISGRKERDDLLRILKTIHSRGIFKAAGRANKECEILK